MSPRTGFTGSALVRLLARLTDIALPESKQAFSDRLGHWVGWTDAIALSAALGAGSPATAAGAPADTGPDEAEFARVRAVLARPIGEDHPPPADFRPWRRRYHARQQAMEVGIGPLRERLRGSLSATSPAMARLATMDAAMEQLMTARERTLLSTVPVLLERHFERLRQAEEAADTWLDAFQQDMQGVLIAELDVRLQPVEGLLEALRSH